ncbi:MAG: acyl-CoA dehydrogenase [Deltaproteobacteria bacterium]|nr:acyl-CoA dehydrogenase [Deltaproteobacteria bacterium]
MAVATNPLLDDRDVEVLLDEVLDLGSLLSLPYFADHDRHTVGAVIAEARRFGREVLYPAYRELDLAPPRLVDGRVVVHPRMHELWRQMVAMDLVAAPRPNAVGGQQLPLVITTLATAYLMAGNCAAYGYLGLTQGAAHLIEAFGDAHLRDEYMARMYRGEWTGTMALTEPQAGSSLSDVATTATPTADGHYLIRGSKIFISGGDHDFADNVVHMTLARIAGAPAGIKGVSLFCVPKRRLEGGALVDNDVAVAGVIHKIGWRGLPSLALNYGEGDDCHGWLVGEPHRGISYMFQMMNEARLMVGLNGVSTASVAYQEAVAYAKTRPQGRPLAAKDPATPQIPIIAHADVRRMLLRQRAIVTGGLALLVKTAWYADVAGHGADADRARAGLLLDLLTPIAKSFPAERGFEANALAVQVHGCYGYSSEYPVESWLRDQKLNTIHEGTTGIQALDLLGRRAVAGGGAALRAWIEEVATTCARAADAGVPAAQIEAVRDASQRVGALTMELAGRGLRGDADGMLLHASDYLELFSIAAVAWQWLELAAVAVRGLAGGASGAKASHYRVLRAAAQYWIATEVPRIDHLARLCASAEDSYAMVAADDF